MTHQVSEQLCRIMRFVGVQVLLLIHQQLEGHATHGACKQIYGFSYRTWDGNSHMKILKTFVCYSPGGSPTLRVAEGDTQQRQSHTTVTVGGHVSM